MRARTASLVIAAAVAVAVLLPATPGIPASRPSLASYRGLGAWIDLYDEPQYADPEGAVADLARRGVKTLYLETANYSRTVDVYEPAAVGRFIEAAHARRMRVVAWYLPGFDDLRRDLRRSMAAIRFTTPNGHRFDSFALDIEASIVTPASERTRRLLRLSRRIRDRAGASYPLGAIIPSPRGMELSPDYWPAFPYRGLAGIYDVFVPMVYFTYRVDGYGDVHRYTTRSIKIIRRETGDATVPIHVIGGIAGDARGAEVRGFVRACRERGVLGASLYAAPDSGRADWREIRKMPHNRRQRPAMPVPVGYGKGLGNLPTGDRSHPKEVFYRIGGRAGDQVLRFQAFDLQDAEVDVLVNWRRLSALPRGPKRSWTKTRSIRVPDAMLRDGGTNLIHFVARANAPRWTMWGVRRVELIPAS